MMAFCFKQTQFFEFPLQSVKTDPQISDYELSRAPFKPTPPESCSLGIIDGYLVHSKSSLLENHCSLKLLGKL